MESRRRMETAVVTTPLLGKPVNYADVTLTTDENAVLWVSQDGRVVGVFSQPYAVTPR
jgi:hypothetical protein